MTALGLAAALPFNQTKGDPLLSLGPVFAIRAKDSVEGEQWALNKGTGGQVLRARYGSVGRAEIRRGIGLITPGTSGNSATIPSSVSLDVSGDFEVMWEGSLDIDTSVNQHLVIRDDQTTGRNWYMTLSGGKCPQLIFWNSAGTIRALTSATGLSISSGQFFALKATVQHDDGGGLTVVKFYTAPSSSGPWVQHGADVTGSYVAPRNLATGLTEDVAVMVQNSTTLANPTTGGVTKRVWFKNGINGTPVFDIDFTQQNDLVSSFTCTTGQTVTVTAANAVDTNDPALNMYTGKNYLYCPGVVGNQLVYGHNAAVGSLNILEYKVKVRPNVLGAVQYMCGTDSTNFGFYLTAAGGISIYCLNTPGLVRIGDLASSAIPGLSTTRDVWLYGRLNITTAQCDYWYSFDSTDTLGNVTWIPLTGGVGSFAGTTPLLTTTVSSMIGSYSIGLAGFNGRFYVFAVLMDSVVRAHIDFTKTTPTILDGASLTGGTTYGRPNGGKKLAFVKAANWNFGGNSYMEIIDNILMNFSGTDDLTIVAVSRMWNRDVTLAPIIAKKATPYTPASDVGWHFGRNTTDMSLSTSDGTTLSQDVEALSAAGSLVISTGIRYGAGKQIAVYNNSTISSSTADSSTGVLTNTLPAQIGKVSTGYSDMELFAIYVFKNKIPTAARIAAAVQYWQVAA